MKKVFSIMTILSLNSLIINSQQKADSLKNVELEEVVVSSIRMGKRSNTAYSNLNESEIKNENAGKNIPFLLQALPSVVSYSEDGTGLGNTYLRIRGTDATRMNVTLNGMPLNNPESQDVFWVNLPDLSNSLQSLQVQRGVGTSSNGTASFGGSISLQTTGAKPEAYGMASTAIGSYNSFISSIAAGTGILKNGISIDGRYSYTNGDGYVRNGKVNHKSGYVLLSHFSEKQLIKLIHLNGVQHTGITWEGASPEELEKDRRYNSSGRYKDNAGNVHYYDNETDNYYSNIVQAIYTRYLTDKLTLNANLSYNNGHGYYENYKAEQKLKDKFGLQPQVIDGVTYKKSDVIRRKSLANDYYVALANVNYKNKNLNLTTGGMYGYFDGSHYGLLHWVKYNQNIPTDYEWYREESSKRDANTFLKADYTLFDKLNLSGEMQYRYVDYRMKGLDDDMVDISKNYYYSFLNPKVGVSYQLDLQNNLYASFGISNREPQRADLKNYRKSNQTVNPERLYDYEIGYRYSTERFSFESNFYYMRYKDQLVSTGKLSSSGYRLQENVPVSYRMGIELSAAYQVIKRIRLDANTTWSRNKIANYTAYYTTYNNQTDWTLEENQLSQFFEKTDISYSPNLIASGVVTFIPFANFHISLVNKYVGKMYYDNTSNPKNQLDDYYVANLVGSYKFVTNKRNEIEVQMFINNIFDKKYVANAWVDTDKFADGSPEIIYKGLFPQAPQNIMGRISVRF